MTALSVFWVLHDRQERQRNLLLEVLLSFHSLRQFEFSMIALCIIAQERISYFKRNLTIKFNSQSQHRWLLCKCRRKDPIRIYTKLTKPACSDHYATKSRAGCRFCLNSFHIHNSKTTLHGIPQSSSQVLDVFNLLLNQLLVKMQINP